LTNFNDTCVIIFSLLHPPSLVFAVSYNWSLQDSGHMALRAESDNSITFCRNQVAFNYVNTSIQVFFYEK